MPVNLVGDGCVEACSAEQAIWYTSFKCKWHKHTRSKVSARALKSTSPAGQKADLLYHFATQSNHKQNTTGLG